MTLKGGTSQACAACKSQRRRCSSECLLAPYFPADQPKTFQNAQKLFGVSNIVKILKSVDESQKYVAMQTVIFQANMRERFPVYGCCAMISQLNYQICLLKEELHTVHTQLALYKHQISSAPNESPQLQLGMAPPNNSLSLFHQAEPYDAVATMPVTTHESFGTTNNSAFNALPCIDSRENVGNQSWIQQTYNTTNDNNNSNNTLAIHSQLTNQQALLIQQDSNQDIDEIYPFFDTIDDRQSYIDSKEAYESSILCKISQAMKDGVEQAIYAFMFK
ncbi:Lateral organ boundaries, LOB [Dillenia turbinata]|uniref:Lateral organ boundaries, LOB n=1 Tax=Dillenia turbinata TaxID=194707 RepID=A0AAN8V7J2_9MAGN